MLKFGQHQRLKSQWEALSTKKDEVDTIIDEMKNLEERNQSLSNLMRAGSIPWSRKLNILSDVLIRGVWLTKVAYVGGVFYIEGSAFSKDNKEMVNIHNFTLAVKNNEDFLKGFSELDLGSIRRRKVGKMELVDFVLSAHLLKESDGH